MKIKVGLALVNSGFEMKEFRIFGDFLALKPQIRILTISFLIFRRKMVQKDAPGPISPLRISTLRVRIGSVWALGAQFDPVFGVFDFRKNVF